MQPYFYILLALVPFLTPRRYRGFTSSIAIILGAIVVASAAFVELTDIRVSVEVGRWLPSFTPIGAFFALLFSVTICLSLVASVSGVVVSRRSGSEVSFHLASAIVLFFALVGVLGASSRYEFLFYWELMSLSSFAMLMWNARVRESLHAAVGYFIVMHVGFFFIFGAFMALDPSAHLFGVGTMSMGIWLLFFVGFALKSALFPLNFWLSPTYRAANPLTAAMLSGAVTNIGLYGIISITYATVDMLTVGYILIFVGAATALIGAMKMVGRTTIRGVLSYSSIDNIGIIVLGLGIGFYGKATGDSTIAMLAIIGAMLHIWSHGVAKTLLFVSAGQVEDMTRTSRLSALGGVARRMPITSSVFAVGGLSLCAMPPLGGFVGEFMILSAMFSAVAGIEGSILGIGGIVVLALATASTIFNVSKMFGLGFLGRHHSKCASGLRENLTAGRMAAYAVLMAVILFGVWIMLWVLSSDAPRILGVEADVEMVERSAMWICAAMALMVVLTAGLYWLKSHLTRSRENVQMGTWSCAADTPSQSRQSAESWVGEAHDTFTLPLGSRNDERRRLTRRASPSRLMRHWTARLALLQTGRTSHYVMHILLFLILVLILTLTHAI